MSETEYRIILALTHMDLTLGETELLLALLYHDSLTRVFVVDEYAVARITYEFVDEYHD